MRRRNKRSNVVDSEEESDSEAPDSDDSVDSSDANKTATPKRKPGRPRGAKNKRQRLQDDSDEDDSSPQPSTSQNANDQSSSQESDEDSGSDYSVSAVRKKATPQKRRGRPPVARKRQRLQSNSDDNSSPQPSTSQNANNVGSTEEFENESSSESADSDYGPVNDRSLLRKKPPPPPPRRRRRPPPRAASSPKKKPNNSVNSVTSHKASVNGTHLDTSQRKNTKLSQSIDSFDPKLVEDLAQKLVYFLLIEDQKKYAIRRKAIVIHVFKDEVYTPKLYSAVMKKANTVLKKTFGMELMELENQKDCYLIVNILRRELGIHDYVELPRIKQQQHGLILFLLTVIYMNENIITEDELTRCLKPLGIDLTSKRLHPVFGDVKKYITTELVKQMYLNYECICKDPPKYEFTWGLRAKQEFDKRDLLQFVCQIMDDTSPEDWRIQFKDAETSAKPSADS